MAISVPPKGDADKKLGANFAPLSVSAQDTPNLTVKIRAGWFYNTDGDVIEYSGGNSPSITPPGSNARWSIVALTDTGSVAIIHGTASATPVLPALPAERFPLAFVYLTNSSTAITNERIFDARPIWRSMDAVANLSAELADRPTFTDLNNELADKADVDGTPNYLFALNNADAPAADAMFVVKRGVGLDVAIRWNESTDQWEITNDGVTFDPIGTVGGSFMSTVPAAVDGNVAIFATGEVADSGVAIGDLATDAEIAAAVAPLATSAALTAHTSDATIHFTLPIAQGDVTGLVAALAAKADVAGETFTDDIVVDNGVDQPISLAQFDAGSSGLLVDRSGVPGPNAVLEWDESTDQWMAGIVGSVFPILTAENLALADLTDVDDALAPGAGDVLRFVGGEWTADPLADFATDAEVTAAVAAHAALLTLHLTTDQNTFLDALNLPTLVAADVNQLAGITVLETGDLGVTVQDWDADLDGLSALAGTGIVVHTGAGTYTERSIASADSSITVTNGDGVAGNVDIVVNEANVDHDALLNFVADEHVAHSGVVLTAGVGLTGGGDITVSRTFDLEDTAVTPASYGTSSQVGQFTVDQQGRLTAAANVAIDHDALTNFVANEHVDHTSVTLTAGTGLTGGGDISTNRTFNVASFKGSQGFTFGAIADGAVGDSSNTLTVSGAVVGDPVVMGLPATVPAGFTYNAYVSAADTVTVRAANHGGGTNAGDADATISVIVLTYSEF